jgi:hypothetical protein
MDPVRFSVGFGVDLNEAEQITKTRFSSIEIHWNWQGSSRKSQKLLYDSFRW